ncbi:MAG: DNA polymerase III subunit beta [Candidatus Woesebacteria bacterium]|jgi:DNA polymerase-3 subunit beta
MKLKVLQENLSKALSTTSRFVSNRAQLPVLSNVLLTADKSSFQVAATNLELSIVQTVGAKVEKKGEITAPSKTLTDLVNNLNPGAVNLTVAKEQIKIASDNFKSTVLGMNPSDFPDIPRKTGKNAFNLPGETFTEALAKVLFAASVDETRPVLTGVLLIFDKKNLFFVATDGFRLSQKKIPLKTSKKIKETMRFIIPKNALSEVTRLAEDDEDLVFSYKKGESQVIFEMENTILASRLIEGEFPDFEKIIPKDTKTKINVDRQDLIQAVKLSSVFARDSANVVKLKIEKDTVEFSAESSQSGSQNTKVDAKVEGKKGFEIAFNYKFLEELLNCVEGDSIVLKLNDANSPGVFTDPEDKEFLHLIMPVKLQS